MPLHGLGTATVLREASPGPVVCAQDHEIPYGNQLRIAQNHIWRQDGCLVATGVKSLCGCRSGDTSFLT